MWDKDGSQQSAASNPSAETESPTSQTINLESTTSQVGRKDEEKQTPKRKAFQMSACVPKKIVRPPQHKLSQLQKDQSNPTSLVAPSETIVRKLSTAKMVMGVDIETTRANKELAVADACKQGADGC